MTSLYAQHSVKTVFTGRCLADAHHFLRHTHAPSAHHARAAACCCCCCAAATTDHYCMQLLRRHFCTRHEHLPHGATSHHHHVPCHPNNTSEERPFSVSYYACSSAENTKNNACTRKNTKISRNTAIFFFYTLFIDISAHRSSARAAARGGVCLQFYISFHFFFPDVFLLPAANSRKGHAPASSSPPPPCGAPMLGLPRRMYTLVVDQNPVT